MERGTFSSEELPEVIDELFEWSDANVHQALFRILQLIREEGE